MSLKGIKGTLTRTNRKTKNERKKEKTPTVKKGKKIKIKFQPEKKKNELEILYTNNTTKFLNQPTIIHCFNRSYSSQFLHIDSEREISLQEIKGF